MPTFPDLNIEINWSWSPLPTLPKIGTPEWNPNIPFPTIPTFSVKVDILAMLLSLLGEICSLMPWPEL